MKVTQEAEIQKKKTADSEAETEDNRQLTTDLRGDGGMPRKSPTAD